VEPVERTNFRHADLTALGAPFEVVVVDLSFISLRTVAPALRAAGEDGTDYVALVKPQFEVGKHEVGKGGIVREPALHRAALIAVADGLEDHGLGAHGAVASPITGAKGNREFLLWCRIAPAVMTRAELEAVADQ
jgi:23S rRNA (cytidine1920-2'-O)/16S rRNA (cytidine1409-2'-O)-methyltransferase